MQSSINMNIETNNQQAIKLPGYIGPIEPERTPENVAIAAICEAYRHDIRYNDLMAIRPGSTRDDAILPPSVLGNSEKEELCRDVVEAVISYTASHTPTDPTPLVEPEGTFEVRAIQRGGWEWVLVISSAYYYDLKFFLAYVETGSWTEAWTRAREA
jgi:hypothetical protein